MYWQSTSKTLIYGAKKLLSPIVAVGVLASLFLLTFAHMEQSTVQAMSGVIVSDDFNSCTLNSGLWSFVNPTGNGTLMMTGEGARLAVPAGTVHDTWGTGPGDFSSTVPRLRQVISNADFEVEVKFEGGLAAANQWAGLLIEEDSLNLLRVEFLHEGTGFKAFAASFVNGAATVQYNTPITLSDPIYMRLARVGNTWTQSYSSDGTAWTALSSFNHTMTVAALNVYVGNGNIAHDVTVDYVFDTLAPINPEDPNGLPHSLTINSVGNGSVVPNPNKPMYGCDEVVDLTAQPSSGWMLQNWSGDVTGTSNPISITMNANKMVTATFTNTTDFPVFDLWYGDTQQFGNPGDGQVWINVLGNVTDTDGIATLTYALNGGLTNSLSVGPDTRRLADAGDFNVEIDRTALNVGVNLIELVAADNIGSVTTKTVTITYGANIWPLPYSVDWNAVSNIQAAVQIIDGHWSTVPGGLRTSQVDYDRVLAVGDLSWTDYEITVPITIHAIDPDGYQFPSVSPGLGVTMRWQGHTDSPVVCPQPHCGWLPSGAPAWYDIGAGGPLLLDGINDSSVTMNVGDTYYWKVRVETISGVGPRYALKVWPSTQSEPAAWNLTSQRGLGDMANGAPIIVAHHVDVTVGDIAVAPITPITYTLNVATVGNGSVNINPDQPNYNLGDNVILTAIPDPGHAFSGWSGDATGTANPLNVAMMADTSITATFMIAPPANMFDSDDFNSCTFNSSLWTFVNPDGDGTMALTGEGVLMTVPAGTTHDTWGTGPGDFASNVPRIRQNVDDTDFAIEVKFEGGLSADNQWEGILIEEDSLNMLRIEMLRVSGGVNAFAASFTNGANSIRYFSGIPTFDPQYMRIVRSGDQWTQSYSSDGTNWTLLNTFTHAMTVTAVGVYIGNSGVAHSATIDYAFNTSSPIVPEDPNGLPHTLSLNTVGSGTAAANPSRAAYGCDETVVVTATPATDWIFTTWSGDIVSTTNPLTLTMSADLAITATFSYSPQRYINAAGPLYNGSTASWAADYGFTGGAIFSVTQAIANTVDDPLYQTARQGTSFSYSIPVPTNGCYDITLHFAELFWGAPGGGAGGAGARVFDVAIEGVPELDDFDIFAASGALTANAQAFEINILDSAVDITFTAVTDEATVSAIEIAYDRAICGNPTAVSLDSLAIAREPVAWPLLVITWLAVISLILWRRRAAKTF